MGGAGGQSVGALGARRGGDAVRGGGGVDGGDYPVDDGGNVRYKWAIDRDFRWEGRGEERGGGFAGEVEGVECCSGCVAFVRGGGWLLGFPTLICSHRVVCVCGHSLYNADSAVWWK